MLPKTWKEMMKCLHEAWHPTPVGSCTDGPETSLFSGSFMVLCWRAYSCGGKNLLRWKDLFKVLYFVGFVVGSCFCIILPILLIAFLQTLYLFTSLVGKALNIYISLRNFRIWLEKWKLDLNFQFSKRLYCLAFYLRRFSRFGTSCTI